MRNTLQFSASCVARTAMRRVSSAAFCDNPARSSQLVASACECYLRKIYSNQRGWNVGLTERLVISRHDVTERIKQSTVFARRREEEEKIFQSDISISRNYSQEWRIVNWPLGSYQDYLEKRDARAEIVDRNKRRARREDERREKCWPRRHYSERHASPWLERGALVTCLLLDKTAIVLRFTRFIDRS